MKRRTKKRKKFDKVYRSYSSDIYKVCFYFTGDEQTAQDIAVQTFMDYYINLEDVAEEHVLTYLVHTAKNKACNLKTGGVYEQ